MDSRSIMSVKVSFFFFYIANFLHNAQLLHLNSRGQTHFSFSLSFPNMLAQAHTHMHTFFSYKPQFFEEIVYFGNSEKSHRMYF